MKLWDYLAVLVLVGCGVAASWMFSRMELRAALDMRPPIVVVDYGPIAKAVAEGRPSRSIEPMFVELKRRSAALKEAGFLVLNAATVDGIPEEILVGLTPEMIAALTQAPPAQPDVSGQAVTNEEAAAILSDLFSPKGRTK